MAEKLVAHVFVDSIKTATFHQLSDGSYVFRYLPETLNQGGPAVATSLPLSTPEIHSPSGAIPPFFSNLLPEGRRLSNLKRQAKTSLDNELALLLTIGNDTIGNVSVLPPNQSPTPQPPPIDLDESGPLAFSEVRSSSGIVDPTALPGAQDKASARTIAAPVSANSADFILKISPPEYPKLVENEAACFNIVSRFGRALTYSHTKVLHDRNGRSGLLVSRFDRYHGQKFAVEDGAQLLGLYPGQKYSPSTEELAAALKRVSRNPQLALRTLAYMTALAWLTGNGDFHAKNISVINRGRGFEVAPVYDIPSTIPYGDTTLALTVDGVESNLSAKSF